MLTVCWPALVARVSRTKLDVAPVPYIEQPAETASAVAGQFSLRNACVTFYNTSSTLRRAHFVSLEGVSAFVHGFNEFQQGFRRLAIIRPVTGATERNTLHERCPRYPLGLAVAFSTDNIFHQMRHVPGDYDILRHHAREGAEFIPVVSHWAGTKWDHAPHFRSFAWEFTVRALTDADPKQLTASLLRLLTPPHCACYDQLEGAVSEHNPFGMGERERTRQQRWRAAAISNAARLLRKQRGDGGGLLGSGFSPTTRTGSPDGQGRLLFIARETGTRVVTNTAEILRHLRAQHPNVQHTVLERLPVAQQMLTVASSAGLIGAHGSGLVWTAFLPTASRRTAVVEMLPRPNSVYWGYAAIFPDLCAPLGVRHWTVRAELTPSPTCKPKGSRKDGHGSPLRCDLTVNVTELLNVVRHAEEWVNNARAFSPGPALYDSWRVLSKYTVDHAPWGVPLASLAASKAAPEWLQATQRPLK